MQAPLDDLECNVLEKMCALGWLFLGCCKVFMKQHSAHQNSRQVASQQSWFRDSDKNHGLVKQKGTSSSSEFPPLA